MKQCKKIDIGRIPIYNGYEVIIMLFFYIRHGDPIYQPNSLTPLGHRQAEAVARRLARYGIDEIYASTSERAKLTAKPTCEILKKELTELDFANEAYGWSDLTTKKEDGKTEWLFHHTPSRMLLTDPEIVALGEKWYTHPAFAAYDYKAGIERVRTAADKFFLSLGYEHIPGTGKYKVIAPNDKRVALFAHQGFGLSFLSCVLDIPYPTFCTHFDMCHSGMTVIEFKNEDGFAIPRVMTLSDDSHLYAENLPTKYNHEIYF